jgi:hypothetical protein
MPLKVKIISCAYKTIAIVSFPLLDNLVLKEYNTNKNVKNRETIT